MNIQLTPRALDDLGEISDYIQAKNPAAARRVGSALEDGLTLISRYPEAGRLLRQEVRRFPLPRYPYLIFYRVDERSAAVTVLAIRHAARNNEKDV